MPLSLPSRALAIAAIAVFAACNRQAAVGSPSSTKTTTPASTAAPAAPGFTTVTFERTPCFGTCPVYRVSVSGSGTITFKGTRNVDSVGTFTGHIDAAAVSALRRAFDDAKYFTLASKYDQSSCPSVYGTDAQHILTSITTAEQSKSIEHDLGCGTAVPAQLADLYRKFDSIVGTSRWMGQR